MPACDDAAVVLLLAAVGVPASALAMGAGGAAVVERAPVARAALSAASEAAIMRCVVASTLGTARARVDAASTLLEGVRAMD